MHLNFGKEYFLVRLCVIFYQLIQCRYDGSCVTVNLYVITFTFFYQSIKKKVLVSRRKLFLKTVDKILCIYVTCLRQASNTAECGLTCVCGVAGRQLGDGKWPGAPCYCSLSLYLVALHSQPRPIFLAVMCCIEKCGLTYSHFRLIFDWIAGISGGHARIQLCFVKTDEVMRQI